MNRLLTHSIALSISQLEAVIRSSRTEPFEPCKWQELSLASASLLQRAVIVAKLSVLLEKPPLVGGLSSLLLKLELEQDDF